MNLDLDYKILGRTSSDQFIAGVDVANAIFDLPNSQQSLMYFHAAAGFPTKESFTDAVRAGNYATWPGLTTTLISKHFPNSDETQKGHMKGQRKGVRSTQVKPAVEIKIKPGQEDAPPKLVAIRKLNDIFVKIYELAETIHTDQTGAFPVTSQRGYRYIMVYFLRNDEKQNGGRNDQCLPENGGSDAIIRVGTQAPPVRQRVLRKLQGVHSTKTT
jgi:hypothetical protein